MQNIPYKFFISSYHKHFWLDFILFFKMLLKLASIHMDLDVFRLKYIKKDVVKLYFIASNRSKRYLDNDFLSFFNEKSLV